MNLEHKNNLIEHFLELKLRLIYVLILFFTSFAFAYFYVEEIYQLLLNPLLNQWQAQDRSMIYTNLTEVFFSYIKLSYYVALFITIPFFVCQLYIFIAPGLYKKEKKQILPFLVLSPILFLLGAVFVYFVIFPLAWQFFLGFESFGNIPVKLEAKVSEYLSITINMIIAFGIAFQMPILIILLVKVGVISPEALVKKRKFAIIFIFILAAVLTPPDAISQVGLAIPMLILYELSILVVKKNKKEEKNA